MTDYLLETSDSKSVDRHLRYPGKLRSMFCGILFCYTCRTLFGYILGQIYIACLREETNLSEVEN